jgi:type II secretory pathway pseudopilin PulG
MAQRRRRRRNEQGFLLIGTFTTLIVGSILAAVMAQEWSVIERREREKELLFIQEQYAAAIAAFQTDQGRLPTKLEELVEKKGQKNQAFLRKPFVDPMTRDAELEDWCLLQLAATGRVVSSCSKEGDVDQLGLGSEFQLGEQVNQPRQQRNLGGNNAAAGQRGIVGVHSKSKERAFNVLKRGEETYDRWYYTFEDYRKEMSAKGIPGMPQGFGPEVGKNKPGQRGNQRGGSNNRSPQRGGGR